MFYEKNHYFILLFVPPSVVSRFDYNTRKKRKIRFAKITCALMRIVFCINTLRHKGLTARNVQFYAERGGRHMAEMTLRELCDSLGVSRRAVQGYEKAGLVSPEGKTKTKKKPVGKKRRSRRIIVKANWVLCHLYLPLSVCFWCLRPLVHIIFYQESLPWFRLTSLQYPGWWVCIL